MTLLNCMHQKPNESVTDFCNRIKQVLNKLKNSIPTGTTKQFWFSHTEKYAIHCLQDGLNDLKIQARLSSVDHTSFLTHRKLKRKNKPNSAITARRIIIQLKLANCLIIRNHQPPNRRTNLSSSVQSVTRTPTQQKDML